MVRPHYPEIDPMSQTTVYAEAFPLLPTQMASSSARNEVQSTYRTGRSTMTSPIFTDIYLLSTFCAFGSGQPSYTICSSFLLSGTRLVSVYSVRGYGSAVGVLSKFSTHPSRQLRAL